VALTPPLQGAFSKAYLPEAGEFIDVFVSNTIRRPLIIVLNGVEVPTKTGDQTAHVAFGSDEAACLLVPENGHTVPYGHLQQANVPRYLFLYQYVVPGRLYLLRGYFRSECCTGGESMAAPRVTVSFELIQ